MRALLRDAEDWRLADHLGTNIRGIHADCVVGAVTNFGVGLGGGLDVGPDTTEPEQIDGRLQDGRHDVHRCGGRRFQDDCGRGFRPSVSRTCRRAK